MGGAKRCRDSLTNNHRLIIQAPSTTSDPRKHWAATLHDAVGASFLRADSRKLLVRIGVSAGDIDPYYWLSRLNQSDRIIWHARHHNEIVFACGSACVVSGDGPSPHDQIDQEVSEILNRPGDEMRFYGGLRFDQEYDPDEIWSAFSGYRFVLPRFEFISRGDQIQVYCNLVFPEDHDHRENILMEILAFETEPAGLLESGSVPVLIGRENHPERDVWAERITWALNKFEENGLEKVVLARRADLYFESPIEPFKLLKQLLASTPNCFHYHFEAPDGSAFIGATPERLFYRNGLTIESEAVAGTQPRGETVLDDEVFRASLLTSEKELREHAYVREYIRNVLAEFCESVSIDHEASEMKLTRGRHLVSRITGVLRASISNLEILKSLHPTPAVSGFPNQYSVDVIREVEEFDRGWYAGPVGWIGRDAAHFAVALRCGLIRGNTVALFSGAGIVKGSEPLSEWKEIEQKILDFINVLELDLERTQ